MSRCNRTEVVQRIGTDDYTGDPITEWVSQSACNFVDLSLHSYMCITCGERMWYSERGKIAEQSGRNVYDVADEELPK